MPRSKNKTKRKNVGDNVDVLCLEPPPLIELDPEDEEEIMEIIPKKIRVKKAKKVKETLDNSFLTYDDYDLEIKSLLDNVCHSIRDLRKSYVLVVSGASNTGKSTFVRYFINSALLHKDLTVYHMECDCGQTEFTVPGCVSMTKINEPIIGEPCSHLRNSEICYYFGDFAPAVRPEEYLHLISEVKKRFDSVSELNPSLLVVNTNGWTTGRGEEILLNVLNISNPDHIICMRGGPIAEIMKTRLPSTPLTIIGFAVIEGFDFPNKNGVLARERSITNYFDQMLNGEAPSSSSFREIVPYTVPWKKMKVSVIHAASPPDYLMSALIGNVIALCRCNKTPVSSCTERWCNDPEFPFILPEDHFPLECLGFGIVRAIDTKQKMFYIITPLEIEKLKNVDVLVKGAVCLPKKLILREAADSPYDSIFVLNQPKLKKETKISRALHGTLRIKSKFKKRIIQV